MIWEQLTLWGGGAEVVAPHAAPECDEDEPCEFCGDGCGGHRDGIVVLVTGSRSWSNMRVIQEALSDLIAERGCRIDELIHGDARGADRMAGLAAAELGIKVTAVPADWDRLGVRAGKIRNNVMVAMKPDVVLAFHAYNSPGTAHCIGIARDAQVPVRRYNWQGEAEWVK